MTSVVPIKKNFYISPFLIAGAVDFYSYQIERGRNGNKKMEWLRLRTGWIFLMNIFNFIFSQTVLWLTDSQSNARVNLPLPSFKI